MSIAQVEDSIITIANDLFGRKWSTYSKDKTPDPDTLPNMSNYTHTEPCFEAMTLNAIVEEMMTENSETLITYSFDGSAMSGWGHMLFSPSLLIEFNEHCLL